jgi:glutathione synthase/RimK-type ligase-like ATP-grasp enzyme
MLIQFATAPGIALTDDDLLAGRALRDRGAEIEAVTWGEPSGPVRPAAVVIRSCWDYHLREAEFRAWLTRLEGEGVRVINPPALVGWNLHKAYLIELSRRGVPIVPTVLVSAGAGDQRSLAGIMADERWDEAVVKPAVSLNAYETWRVTARGVGESEDEFARLRVRRDVLVQRYVPEVTDAGEWSLMFFGARFSHAVRKRPKAGDFRVQTEHGGSATTAAAPSRLVAAAARVLAALPERPIYCRVDGVLAGGTFVVMEVECIDPVLFFSLHAPAAESFADEVLRRIGHATAAGG